MHLARVTSIDALSILRLVASLVGGYIAITSDYLPRFYPFWIWNFHGLVFGVVVLVWQARTVRELFHPRSADFLLASTLTYALVIWLITRSIKIDGTLDPTLSGTSDWPILRSVALGTILLGLAHVLLLRAAWRQVLVAIPGTLGVWYFASGWSRSITDMTVWQVAYMLLMFARRSGRDPMSAPTRHIPQRDDME